MAKTKDKEEKPAKKGPVKKLLSLFRNPFARNKESVADFKLKKEAEAEVMMEAVNKILRKQRGLTDDSIASWEGDDKEEIYLYDFLSEAYGDGGLTMGGSFDGDADGTFGVGVISNPNGTTGGSLMLGSSIEKKEPKKIFKPIEVFGELGRVPAPVNLEDLDEKIAILKLKKEFIKTNRYAKKEVIDMVTRLENRKKYKEFEPFFSKYDNTTTDKINELVNKYELVMKTSDLFIPKFPKDAMEIMKEYKENVKKLCGKSPVFYVIAEKALFKSEEKRNDPILLVQSPFGIYWQILGAWDKELVLLEEL